MQVVSPDLIKGKKVLLRLDLDVEIKDKKVIEDYRLKAGLPSLKLCLEHADKIIILGHLGRPNGREVPELSVEPIYDWLAEQDNLRSHLESGKLKLLENLRFESGEDDCSLDYAKQLATFGDFFINEAFAAHHRAASTTLLPTLLPHAAGLRFAQEVETLRRVRENPQKPLVIIIGGAKVEDKYPVIKALSSLSEHILVGGLLAKKIKDQFLQVPPNVILGQSNSSGLDLDDDTIEKFKAILTDAKSVVWAGPLGKYEDPAGNIGNKELARTLIQTDTYTLIGGGDTIAALDEFLPKFSFVSVGGGAMLELLSKGSLPTIDCLND